MGRQVMLTTCSIIPLFISDDLQVARVRWLAGATHLLDPRDQEAGQGSTNTGSPLVSAN